MAFINSGLQHQCMVLTVLLSLLASGCNSTSPVEGEAKAQLAAAERIRAIDTILELDAELLKASASDRVIFLSMMRESGMDTELGGAVRAKAELDALSLQFRQSLLGQAANLPRFLKAADGNDAVGYLGSSMVVGAGMIATKGVGVMASENDATGSLYPPPTNTGVRPELATTSTSTLDGTLALGEAVITSTFEGTTDGLTGRVASTMKFDLCPKADGTIKFSLQAQSTLKSRSGQTVSSKSEVEITRTVNDDSEYSAQMDRTAHVEYAVYGGANAGTFVDVTNNLSSSKGTMGETVNRRSSKASNADVKAASDIAKLMTLLGHAAGFAAETAFKSGRCVKLQPTSDPAKRSGVKPETSFALLAAPRSKIDGTPTGGSVKADLTGEGALDPAGSKVPADAKFTYVAPDAKDKKGTVAFEARSKRGIGKATLDFNTINRAYSATGGSPNGQLKGSGKICSLSEPFTLTGTGVTQTFTPSSETGGSYSYTGRNAGVGLFGKGTYTVKADENGGTLTATGPGSVVTPMGTFSGNGTETYKLTPIEGCP